ncbi:MAG: ketoacyl-ACP synthase III [Planctomycetes bacterium]|nr:ketoacyl-ACP synthase III [Planctomycetota bacterium]
MKIAGVGRYLPERVVTSAELGSLCNVSAEWVEEHAGVVERHWASEAAGETNASMAARAGQEALEAAGMQAQDLDCLIYASATVQQLIPDTSVFVLRELGIGNAGKTCLSVHATCLSFVTALDVAASRIASGRSSKVLIVSSEITSIGLNFKDPASAALFGDGAGAAVVTATPTEEASCMEAVRFETYASAAELTTLRGGGTLCAPNDPRTRPEDNMFYMDGPEILRFTLRRIPRFLSRLLPEGGMQGISCIVPHQTSRSGLDSMDRLGMKKEIMVRTLERFGNCVAASIPMALYEAIHNGQLKRGDRCLMIGTSAGLTIGGIVFTY